MVNIMLPAGTLRGSHVTQASPLSDSVSRQPQADVPPVSRGRRQREDRLERWRRFLSRV